MNDLILMHVIQCLERLLHNTLGKWLGQFSLLPEEIVQLARIAQLKHQINILYVTKKRIKLNYVWMVEIGLNLDLAYELDE